jgi:hypothetical protein
MLNIKIWIKHFSFKEEFSEVISLMYIDVHVKCQLVL